MTYNEESQEYVAEDVYLTVDDYFVIRQGEDEYSSESVSDWSSFADGKGSLIRMYNEGTYYLYLTSEGEIYAEEDPELEADSWAEQFVQGVGCSSSDPESGPSEWDWYASDFAYLSNGAKDIFIEATASNEASATFVEQAAFIHDLCVIKYQKTIFMCRDGGGSRAIYILNINNINEFNSTALIIVITSVVATTTLLSLLIIKKHKRK